jgi:hypothetical protein
VWIDIRHILLPDRWNRLNWRCKSNYFVLFVPTWFCYTDLIPVNALTFSCDSHKCRMLQVLKIMEICTSRALKFWSDFFQSTLNSSSFFLIKYTFIWSTVNTLCMPTLFCYTDLIPVNALTFSCDSHKCRMLQLQKDMEICTSRALKIWVGLFSIHSWQQLLFPW